MKRILCIVLGIAVTGALFSACDPGNTQEEAAGPAGAGAGAPIPAPTDDNIGDLEQAVRFDVGVAAQSKGPNIKAKSLEDPTGRLNLLTLKVSPPYPEELWLNFELSSKRAFKKNPGVLRVRIVDGETVLDEFGAVIGDTSIPSVSERTVNVLAAREEIPESMLVTIKVEALLMPEGTDPSTIDPMTAETTEDRYSQAVETPPIRVNFEGAGAPAEETEESGESPEQPSAEDSESGDDAPAEGP
jgi:hypothetical protein